jgi:hypothetical protein
MAPNYQADQYMPDDFLLTDNDFADLCLNGGSQSSERFHCD